MRFHDYYLDRYEVSNGGEEVTFYLIYRHPGVEADESSITFSDVVLYNFIHTTGAIITDIYEEHVGNFIRDSEKEILEWNRLYGVRLFKDNIDNYARTLESEGYKTWHIESAIGFFGFVIGKAVVNA